MVLSSTKVTDFRFDFRFDSYIVDWNRRVVVYDIVMLKLSKPLVMTNEVSPICLPNPGFRSDRKVLRSGASRAQDGAVCVISGWGHTEGRGSNDNLQQATIPVCLT